MAKAKQKEATVAIDREKYTSAKSASGSKSLHTADAVGEGLAGLTLDEVTDVANKFIPGENWGKKYGHLNDGMVRMNLGNRIRGQITKLNKVADKAEADGKKRPVDGDTGFTKVVAPFRKAADKRASDAAKAKAAEKKAAAKAA